MGKKEEKNIHISKYVSRKKRDASFDLVFIPETKEGQAILIPPIGASGPKFTVQAKDKDDARKKLDKKLKDEGY